MVAQFDAPSIVVFLVTTAVLLLFSILDLRERRISNRAIMIGFLVGLIVVLATGQVLVQFPLRLISPIVVVILSYVLWRLGAIGGADLKALVVLSVLSPGLEFATWDVLPEMIAGDCFRVLAMLVLGLLYTRLRRSESEGQSDEKTAPLIPFLFLAYVLSQVFALV